MAKATPAMMASVGCPPAFATEFSGFDLPADFLASLAAVRGFSWLALLSFCRKYIGLLPELATAIRGGLPGVLEFAVAHASELPTLVSDFLAIFSVNAVEPGPVVAP